ncbi:MAG: gliding motility protein GldL [Bacteroidota bacterium]
MTFAEFAETKKFKTIMNYTYSLGAAVVIAGALFKIMHWPGANYALIAGMGTEVLVFCVFAIDPTQVHLELDWTLVYPELAGMHDGEGKEDKKSITEQLDNMLEEAKIGPELIGSLGIGLKSLSDNTAKLTNLSDASVATNEFTDNMKNASRKIGSLSDTYDKASSSISGSISDLEKASGKTSQALDLITNSTQQQAGVYSEQLQKVSKNLGSLNSAYELQLQNSNENIQAASKANAGIQKLLSSLEASMQASQRDAISYGEHLKKTAGNVESLNAAYELQLKTTKEHINKSGKLYEGVERTMASLNESSGDAQKFKQQISAMSENLTALNTVYGNMLTAMSFGKK